VRFELTCVVRAGREDVFSFLEEGDETSGGGGADVERRDAGLRMRLWVPLRGPTNVHVVVLHREPPSRLAYRWTLGRNVDGELDYLLCPHPIGTRLQHGVSMRADGSLGVIRPLLRRALHAGAERRLRRICQRMGGGLGSWSTTAHWVGESARSDAIRRGMFPAAEAGPQPPRARDDDRD